MDNLEGGGAEKALIELLRSIDYSKYEVTLCLSFYKGVYLMDIPKKIKVIKLFKNENTFIFRKSLDIIRSIIIRNCFLFLCCIKLESSMML